MTQIPSLSFNRALDAAPPDVFRALVHEVALRDWLCHRACTQPLAGGAFFFNWDDGGWVAGNYTRFEPPGALECAWFGRGMPGQTNLRVTIEPEAGGTRLSLVHGGFGEGAAWAETAAHLEGQWREALENLAFALETGLDLRDYQRPRLGIGMDEYTPEVARQLGVPVDQGVLLVGTAEGSGARAAGLQKDDVLVSLNGVELLGPSSFQSALKGLKAGDRPVVEFYRGAEKHAVPLELGKFPIPTLPKTAGALAAQVQAEDTKVVAALREQMSGLTAEQATRRPAENEWSPLEIAAHFVLTERDYQSWVAAMLEDRPVFDWLEMRPNVAPRIAALVERIPDLAALLDELALAKEETARMLAGFPDKFVLRRKDLFRRAAEWATQVTPGHYYEEHLEQIQTAVNAAKQAPEVR